MKAIIPLLILIGSSAVFSKDIEATSYNYPTMNAVLIHPMAPSLLRLHITLGEIDYLRGLSDNRFILTRFSYYRQSLGYLSYRSGYHKATQIEIGYRRRRVWAQNRTTRFGGYVQLSSVNGYQEFVEHIYSEEYTLDGYLRTNYDHGYIGSALATIGLHYQRKYFVMSLDIGTGPRFNNARNEYWRVKPNFTIGVSF